MTTPEHRWQQLRDRFVARMPIPDGAEASLSLRIPGQPAMWFGDASADAPRQVPLASASGEAAVHAAVYAARADAGAIAAGGGTYGLSLADFGGTMPQVFDEQARHLGPMGPAAAAPGDLAASLRGGGNVLLLQGRPLCLGTTATRLSLNAELFEKCAKAYVLAAAAGGPVRPLPWFVRMIANRRLRKDELRAAQRLAQGLLPEESQGY
jgi:ribulose-5-phosphate 4-epimerase/fuculose-1-phosphate aldolase